MRRGLAVVTALMAASLAGPALAGDSPATTQTAPTAPAEKAAPADGRSCLDADGNGICDWYQARGGAPGRFVDDDGDGVCDRWQAGGWGTGPASVGPAWGRGRGRGGWGRGWGRGWGLGPGVGRGYAGAGYGRGLGYGRGWGLGPHDGRGRGPYFVDANGNGVCDRFEAAPQAETPPEK